MGFFIESGHLPRPSFENVRQFIRRLPECVSGNVGVVGLHEQMAECRGLAPLARRHALVSTEARLACPADIPQWSAWQDLHLQPFHFERNISSDWTTRGWCPRPDLHRHCARFKCAVSALDYVGKLKLVPREGFPPPTSPF